MKNYGIKQMKKLAIITPCFNEKLALEAGVLKLLEVLDDLILKNKITTDSYLLLINDGSKDNTLEIMERLTNENKGKIQAISLASNVGHQNVLLCGYNNVNCDMAVSIDIDLQDDITKIEDMVDLYYLGNHIVYGVRINRDSDSFFKKYSAQLFYKIMKFLDKNTITQASEFRLMSSFAIEKLKEFGEVALYLRGIIASMNLKSANVYYKRLARELGETKYSISKLVKLALDGLFASSTRPLLLIHILSIVFLFISFVIFGWIIYSILFSNPLGGWVSLLGSIYLVGGFIMLSISLLSSYIARIYLEIKKRPLYFIEKIIK